MDAAIDMYYFPASPPCMAVLLLARALGVALNLKPVDILVGQQLHPDFIKMNPMHTVPTMDDNGYVIWESRAIMQYLVDKYDKQGKFVVTDAKHKGILNNMLYFELTALYPRLLLYFLPVIKQKQSQNQDHKDKLVETLTVLNNMLKNNEWVAGDNMTIADITLVSTISTAEAVGIDISKHEIVWAWYERTKKALAPTGYDELNQKGADFIGEVFKASIP